MKFEVKEILELIQLSITRALPLKVPANRFMVSMTGDYSYESREHAIELLKRKGYKVRHETSEERGERKGIVYFIFQ